MEESTDGPEEGFYVECASGRDFILVKTHFPMHGSKCIRWDLFLNKHQRNFYSCYLLHNETKTNPCYQN